jgi:Flp pilus assembly pilin Flp
MTLRDWSSLLRAFPRHQEGQTMAEYSVVLAVIAVGVVATIGALSGAVAGKLQAVVNAL